LLVAAFRRFDFAAPLRADFSFRLRIAFFAADLLSLGIGGSSRDEKDTGLGSYNAYLTDIQVVLQTLEQADAPEGRGGVKDIVRLIFVVRSHGNFHPKGDQMGNLELAGTLKMLKGERAQVHKELTKLDKAIAVIRELAGAEQTPNGRSKRHTMSAAARRKIAKAQKLRWAKFRKQQKAEA
jgi:hypothetical protein